MIDAFVEAGHGVVIFCTYLEPLRELLKHYGKDAGMIEGSMKVTDRQKIIDDIAEGRKKIALISLKAGGMGINGLQYGSDKVIFLDQSWVPADHHQAQGRVHRNGQKNPVQSFYLLCPETIDEDMRELHIEKQRIADTIVDGDLVTATRQKGIFSEFVRRLQSRMGPALFFEFDEVEE
jgi:SNF2 family DNA or RNA helicase